MATSISVSIDGLTQDDSASARELDVISYVAIKKHPFFITLQASGCLFLDCSVGISLHYYNQTLHTYADAVSYVHTFPVCILFVGILSNYFSV